ncbi:short-chain dehydrogenase [Xylariaceae sp. FL0255]|nr:short-chain dehydrogenase [Xylariaceae sp. FL0255]
MMSKVFIVTGASRGLGLAITQTLLKESHKVFLVARSEEKLQELKSQNPGSVDFLTADLGGDYQVASKITTATVKAFGQIDGLVVNHGTLSPVIKICDSDVEEWRKAYDVNVFSALALVKEAIPELRKSEGRVIFVSSGASTSAYQGWGAYGTSKAALNHLCSHLAIEEEAITTLCISPGKVDTDMQKQVRNEGLSGMRSDIHAGFVQEYESGRLLDPNVPGGVIARLTVAAPKSLNGKHWRWNAEELKEFQSS